MNHSLLGNLASDASRRALAIALTESSASQRLKHSEWKNLTSGQRQIVEDVASLQDRALKCFGSPINSDHHWWVTRTGLQQSSSHPVSHFKASLLETAVPVLDVCCGLGADLISLAGRGPVIGVDRDADILAMAAANLFAAGQQAELLCRDVVTEGIDDRLARTHYLHIDPDRRDGGRRHTRPEDFIPAWSTLKTWLSKTRGGLIKLAPASQLAPQCEAALHRMWISTGRSVREQCVVFGDCLTTHPKHNNLDLVEGGVSAVMVGRAGETHHFSLSTGHAYPDIAKDFRKADKPREWMIDPDPAIRAAGLTAQFAEDFDAELLGGPTGFLTTNSIDDQRISSMSVFGRVVQTLSPDHRKLRKAFRALNAYPEVIKVRGMDLSPERLSKDMRNCGEQPLGLWIGRTGKKSFAAITQLHLPSEANSTD